MSRRERLGDVDSRHLFSQEALVARNPEKDCAAHELSFSRGAQSSFTLDLSKSGSADSASGVVLHVSDPILSHWGTFTFLLSVC